MQVFPAAHSIQVAGIEIEGDDGIGVDVQYPWEDSPRRHHDHQMHDRIRSTSTAIR